MDEQPLYALTEMTGREASSTRTAVVGVVEVPWRVLILLLIGLFTGIPIAVLLWTVLGSLALVVLALWMAAAVWLFHGRTRSGLRIRNYAALLNRRSAVLNQFLLGPAIVKVPHGDWRVVRHGSIDNPAVRVLPEEAAAAAKVTRPEQVVASIFD